MNVPPTEPLQDAAPRPRGLRRRLGRLGLRLAVVLVVGLVGTEACVRWLVLSDSPRARKLGRQLRGPENFAHKGQDAYWKLQHSFMDEEYRRPPPNPDPLLGWRRKGVEAGTYANVEADSLEGRRPLLLFGDSFADHTKENNSWPDLLAASEFGDELALVNYGTGGFGLDQIHLQLREAIRLHVGPDVPAGTPRPLVVFSFLVDDDMDRATLSFRGWPKPHFSITPRGLELDGPIELTTDEYIRQHPPAITSYAWRYLLHGTHVIPTRFRTPWMGRAESYKHVRVLARRLLQATARLFREYDVDGFVLLFHGNRSLDTSKRTDWRTAFAENEVRAAGLPFVRSLDELIADRAESGRGLHDYILATGRMKGHYTDLGNAVVFRTLLSGLRGEFDGPNPDHPSRPDSRLLGPPSETSAPEGGAARWDTRRYPPFGPDDTPRLLLASSEHGVALARWSDTGPGGGRLVATVSSPGAGSATAMRVLVDGVEARALAPSAEPQQLEVELPANAELVIEVSGERGAAVVARPTRVAQDSPEPSGPSGAGAREVGQSPTTRNSREDSE